MPFFPQVTGDTHGIRQVHTEHSHGCPAVQKPGIRRVAAVRVPDRCEVCLLYTSFLGRCYLAGVDAQRNPILFTQMSENSLLIGLR